MIYRPDMHNLQGGKKHLHNKQRLKFILQNMPLLSNLQHQYKPKNIRWSEMRCRNCRVDLYNLKTRQ